MSIEKAIGTKGNGNLIFQPKAIIDETRDTDDVTDVGDARHRLLAFYFIAKFHNKFFSPDKDEQLAATQKAIDFYRRVIDACKNEDNDDVSTSLKEEFKASVDAADMLQRQIQAYDLRDEVMQK